VKFNVAISIDADGSWSTALLAYCRLHALAMVKILEKLYQVASNM